MGQPMELTPDRDRAGPAWSDPRPAFTDTRFDPSPYLHYYQERRGTPATVVAGGDRASFDWGRALEDLIREAFE